MNRPLPIRTLLSILCASAACAVPGSALAAADTSAPQLHRVALPATVAGATVEVSTSATDDVAVTQLRLANEDGTWSAWRPYASSTRWELSAGTGYKAVFVQVRDAAGNESSTILTRLSRTAEGAPSVASPTAEAEHEHSNEHEVEDLSDEPSTVGDVTSTVGDETIAVHNQHDVGRAGRVRTDDGGVLPARRSGEEATLTGIDLPRRRRAQVVRLLNRLHASGRTGRRLVRVLRRSRADIRVADLSSIGAAGTWTPSTNRLVLDIGLLRDAHHVSRVQVLAHEASHALWDRRNYDGRTRKLGGNRVVVELLNEAVANGAEDAVLGDLGYLPFHRHLWGAFQSLTRSEFYRDWYGLGPAEIRRGRLLAPRVIRHLTDDLVELGIDRQYIRNGLPG